MFEKNIKALKETNPILAEKIEKIELDSIKDIIAAEAENKDLIIGYKGIALHSMVDPVREARALWNKTVNSNLKKNDIQIVFGLGLGYLFKRAYLNANSKIFLVEPFVEILRFVLQHVDLFAELSDERVYVADNIKDITDKLREEYLQGDSVEFLILPAYASLAKDMLEDMTDRVLKVIEEKSSDVNTIFNLAPHWTRNLIINMPYFFNSRPLGFFKDMFVDKTALILAAGPSLAENLEKIKANKDKFVTIATGKALKTLVKNDIIPDFVTFADAIGVKDQISGMEDVLEKTNVIITSRTDSDVVGIKAKNLILYLPKTDPFSNLFHKYSEIDPGIYESASSVSIINYFIARAMGFNNIAFAGLDLAFIDNKIYASGEEFKINEDGYIEAEGVKPSSRKIKNTKDKNGMDIATRDDYLIFIRQFEEILENEMSISRVINTSIRGAYVKGMDYAGFDEFIGNLSGQDVGVDKIISGIYEKTENNWSNCVRNVFNEIYSKKDEIKEIQEESEILADDLQNIIEFLEQKSIDEVGDNEINNLNQKLIDTRKKLMGNLILQTALQGIVWNYTKNYITENLNSREVLVNNFKQEQNLCLKTHRYSIQVLKFLEKAYEKMEKGSAHNFVK